MLELPLSGFFKDEVGRFLTGLEGLTAEGQEKQRKALQRAGITPDTPRELSIPKWDDVVHIRPRLQITNQQRDEYWAALRVGRAPQIPGEALQEIERRRGRTVEIPPTVASAQEPAWTAFLPPDEAPGGFDWPIASDRPTHALADIVADVGERIPLALDQLLTELRGRPEENLVGLLVGEIAEGMWRLLEGDKDLFRTSLAPPRLLLERLARPQLLIHPGNNVEAVQRMWDEAQKQVEDSPKRLRTLTEWRALAARHSVDLIRMLPPTAPSEI